MGNIILWEGFAVATILFFWFAVVKIVKAAKRRSRCGSKLPPGRRGWPLIGDSFNWYNAVASANPASFVHQQILRFGRIFTCHIFGQQAVVSADPEFNRFIMHNEGKLFKSSYPKSFRDLVGKNGVITAQGDHQRKLHGIASNMMRLDKLKLHFLNDIQVVLMKTICTFHNNQVIQLQDSCRKLAINMMVNQLLGVTSEAEVTEIAHLFSDFVDGCLSVPINLPGFAYHKAMRARETITMKINKTIEKLRSGRTRPEENGVLGRLVDEGSLPDEAVADFMINLLFAGNETTSKTMLFAVYFISQHPKALKQLVEEHDAFKSSKEENEMLTWQDYKAMPFTQCVIDETLRLGGIAIWLMRETTEEVQYKDYKIPKGSFVVPFLSAVHCDEGLYKRAQVFNPWRWTEPENQDKRNWRTGQSFTPFGGGARFCPGAELARLQIALFLHYFTTTYRWTQTREEKMSFFPSARLVNGFQIRLVRRDSSHPGNICNS
uniref:Abietadienol/abietadienal oxidase n=1 Tax=Kalanchoe fedtschenkoi TaxID=63787 RepID=A0A7N0V9Z0_KALFE